MYLYAFEVDSQTLRFDRMTSERPSGHPGLWTLKRREHHGIRHHATSLPTLPVTALVATLQAASALPSLSNHLNTKRKDAAAASWLWWHPVFLIVGDTSTQVILRPERNAQINAFTRLHKIKWPLCAEALQISRLGYKFVFRFMAGHNLSRRARAAVFPRSEIATPNGAQEQMPGPQCLGCEGERGETERKRWVSKLHFQDI